MNGTTRFSIRDHTDIPTPMLEVWQRLLDLIAEVFHVPAALIMRVHEREIEVFLRSQNTGNVYERGERALLDTGLYCETVMASQRVLLVPNAMSDSTWDHNPDIKLGMIAYLGFPLLWPTGQVFGTMCVLDHKENSFSDTYIRLLEQFKNAVEHDLQLLDAATQLQRSEVRYRTMFNSVLDAVFVTRADGTIVDANDIAARDLGFLTDELTRLRIENVILTEHSWPADILPLAQSGGIFRCEGQQKHKEGVLTPVDLQVARMPLGDDEMFIAVAHNISKRKELERELDRLAVTDSLTNIGNRAGFERAVSWELTQANRYLRPLSVAMIDIDHFKQVNDTFGHAVGDRALAHVCAITSGLLRHADQFYRYGGEEFVILMPETTLEGAVALAERIRSAVAETPMEPAGSITVSIGVTQHLPGEERDALIARVDSALYAAKAAGRDVISTA